MSLSIRHWLAERHIELAQLGQDNAQLAGIAFRIAQDMEVKSLNPFAISVLTEVLELPLTVAWQVAPILSQLTVGLLRILSRKKPLRRSEGTWLSFQVAYLNALEGILEQEAQLRRPWVNRAQVPASPNIDEPLVDPQLIALLKTLRPGRLSDSQAEQALSSVANSFLVKQMNKLAIAWFVANGAEETEAKLLTQRLSNGLAGHLLKVIAENALPLAQLQKFVRLGHLSNTLNTPPEEDEEEEFSTPQLTLDLDREYYRAELSLSLSEPLFAEPFSLKEIYVSLNVTSAPLSIEFSHPSLGDYLAAEELALQLKALTQKLPNQYGEVSFVIDSSLHLAEHLYQLLGYGLLSPQIEELIIERLRREQQRNADAFSFPVLFQRLYRFYRAYCRGRWFDEGVAHRVHQQLRDLNNPLNTLQIDATVGLNVFLILCSAARDANLPFWPCGNPEIPQDFDADQLLSFMGRTVALSPTTFWQRARQSLAQIHLPQACLNRVMLAEANLIHADLSTAELSGINLAAANLQQANLAWASLVGANLADADLKGAQLEGANLLGADLRGANLTSANLTNACLVDAQLDEPNKQFAVKSGAFFSWDEFQSYYQSLVVSPFVKTIEEEHLFEDDPMIFIESAEGEPMLPTIYSQGSDRYDGETEQFDREQLNAQATVSETDQYAGETAQVDEWITQAPVSDTEQYSGQTQQLDEMGQHPSDTEQYAGETEQIDDWQFAESETEEEQLEAGAEQETGVFHEDTIMLDEEDEY
ncbi:MAG: pentapeptide repeat-containing protein [Coleofasciculus sp. C1-SOL-03]|uniref:pentapeptide repeat-containing protein n=1 Tax=Coleofasciculus sp. C1-SOL-03 TaxID=3069522 RepID=UPI0032F37D57